MDILHLRRPNPDEPDDTVSTLSQLLGNGISLVDNKVLVEDLEDLSSLQICHRGGFVGLVFKIGITRAGSSIISKRP